MRKRSEHRTNKEVWEPQQVDKWVGKFLILLAKKGHCPGFRYGKDLYLDLIEFFLVVSRALGISPFEVAVRVAIQDLTRREN